MEQIKAQSQQKLIERLKAGQKERNRINSFLDTGKLLPAQKPQEPSLSKEELFLKIKDSADRLSKPRHPSSKKKPPTQARKEWKIPAREGEKKNSFKEFIEDKLKGKDPPSVKRARKDSANRDLKSLLTPPDTQEDSGTGPKEEKQGEGSF